jgi:hypothetical protein
MSDKWQDDARALWVGEEGLVGFGDDGGGGAEGKCHAKWVAVLRPPGLWRWLFRVQTRRRRAVFFGLDVEETFDLKY